MYDLAPNWELAIGFGVLLVPATAQDRRARRALARAEFAKLIAPNYVRKVVELGPIDTKKFYYRNLGR